MSVKIWDAVAQAWKEAETPKIWDNENSAHRDSTGLVFDTAAEAWKEKWSPMPDKIYLYNRGDECVDVTGVWTGSTVMVEGNSCNDEYYKKSDHLLLRSYEYTFYPVFFNGNNLGDLHIYIPKNYRVGILAAWEIRFYQDNYSIKTPNTGVLEFGFVQTDGKGEYRYSSSPKWQMLNQTSIWANIGNYQHSVSAEFGPSALYTNVATEDMNGYFRVNVKYSSKRSTRDTTIELKIYEIWLEKVS